MEGLFQPNLKTEDARVKAFAKFVMARHVIFLKRAAGLEKPWTKDPILGNYSFTNVYRELDRVSIWIVENILKPYEGNPELPFMLAAARMINWPESLQELLDAKALPVDGVWRPALAYKVLKARAQKKQKVITGAYIVNSIIPKDHTTSDNSKCYYIPHVGLQGVWDRREAINAAARKTMEGFVRTLSECKGWGSFMSYQVCVDLGYSKKWLGKAPDLNTFTSPGPGTTKGMNWLLTGKLGFKVKGKNLNEDMIRLRGRVNEELMKIVPPHLITGNKWTGFEEVGMSDFSNCNCEMSKYVRSLTDGGSSMKSKYPGQPTALDNQKSLF